MLILCVGRVMGCWGRIVGGVLFMKINKKKIGRECYESSLFVLMNLMVFKNNDKDTI